MEHPMAFTYTPITPVFGADVHGVDLAGLTDSRFADLYALWKRQHVLVLRDQHPTQAQFERVAAMLGELEASPQQGEDAATHWHSDRPHLERPPFAALVWATELPASGGDSWFASMPAALRSMPADLVRRISRLDIRHDGSDDPLQPGGAIHPAVIVQPETGEHTLYLGRRRNAFIPGLPTVESERLLNIIWSYATAGSVCLSHRWRVGDVVLWNNVTTMHRRDFFPADQVRVLQRAQVKGRHVLAAPIQEASARDVAVA
jgi:taurine dioxygenase